MTLTDRERLELNELCGGLVDGTSTEAQRARLAELLRSSEVARRHYVRAMAQSASLHDYAAEMLASPRDEAPGRAAGWWRGWSGAWWGIGLAAAAALLLVAFFSGKHGSGAAGAPGEVVARLTGMKSAQWARESAALAPGALVRRGQRIELSGGLAELTFDSGARVVLEGAASLEINSAWDATLRRGTLQANVPPEAVGFRVSSRAVDVVDLGTEFTMIADASGAAEVLVHKGEVEAAPRGAREQETILLRENEARRFAESGVSDVVDSERKLAHFAQPPALERFSPVARYVRWSFDEAAGGTAQAEIVGGAIAAQEAPLKITTADGSPVERTAGRHGGALRLNGQTEARADFPGISSSRPRTIAFWVRVPENAPWLDAYSIVAWATHLPKIGARPVQISWNRRSGEGAIGALRTDFGGGYAMGTTSLLDGRWHHVAVYFAAGDDPSVPVQVTQYVDGRLESGTIVQTKMSTQPGRGDAAITDVVWLGCRLTSQARRQHFRGEIDELLIADRGLEPNEIVSLMKHNRLLSTLAANP